MGRGIRYSHIVAILKKYYRGGKVLEIAAGGCLYRDIFTDYMGTDLPTSRYYEKDDLTLFCDAQYLPFKEDSFDLIFIVGALHQIKKPDFVINEVFRVLNPGGQFIVFDYNKPTLKRLKKIDDDFHRNNHIWHPWELDDLLKKGDFHTHILLQMDYSLHIFSKILSLICKIPGIYLISNNLFELWTIIRSEKGLKK